MKNYFTKAELLLLSISSIMIIISHLIFADGSYFMLMSSLIGVVALIFNAKGNPIGQLLVIIFSILYGIISYKSAYYGEMITYLGMTMPMAAFALFTWLKNPYNGNKSEVRINRIRKKEYILMSVLTFAVTLLFYFILRCLGTAELFMSTLSVTTSFLAVYLTARRSPLFALCYAANDIVLIILWSAASIGNKENISVVVCFAAFLVNDFYGYFNWRKMQKRQQLNM